MKVECIDNDIIIYLKDISTDNYNELCIDIINKLNKYFNTYLKGFYTVNIYIDKSYGIVMEIKVDDNDLYLDYDTIDLHIITHNSIFLFEVDDILDLDIDKYYTYKDKYYIDIDNIYNLEFIKVIYKGTKNIIKNMKCKKN